MDAGHRQLRPPRVQPLPRRADRGGHQDRDRLGLPGEWDAGRVNLRGRDLLTGLPRSVEVGADQIREAIEPSVQQIVDTIRDTIEETPPELVADIMDQGIVLAGGGALLAGLDQSRRRAHPDARPRRRRPAHLRRPRDRRGAPGSRPDEPGACHRDVLPTPALTRRPGSIAGSLPAEAPRMSALLATKSARRQAAAYVALLVVSVLLLTLSSNPLVRDLQHGVAFAFKPFPSRSMAWPRTSTRSSRRSSRSTSSARRTQVLREQNEQLDAEARTAEELRRENEQLTALLQLRNGLEYQTTSRRRSSRGSRTTSGTRSSSIVAPMDGLEVGDIVITPRRRPGRADRRGRIELRPHRAHQRLDLHGHRPALGRAA